MSIWTKIAGTLLGGLIKGKSEKEAAETEAEGAAAAQALIAEQVKEAKRMIFDIVPIAERNLQAGNLRAMQMIKAGLPEQVGLGRGGNIAAQQTLLAGLGQQQSAILGDPLTGAGLGVFEGAPVVDPGFGMPSFESSITPGMRAALDPPVVPGGNVTPALTEQELMNIQAGGLG